ncbi:MAG: sugar ABC transporter substrate-binding protein [Microbacterium gubbeenense]
MLTLAACSGGGTANDGADPGSGAVVDGIEPRTIGWVDAVLAGSFQERLHSVAEEAIEHVGWKMKTVDTAGDASKAASGVSSLVSSGVDAIILSAVTPSTARAGLLQAQAKGIPVLMVGSAVDNSLNEELGLTYIGEDEDGLSAPLAELMTTQLTSGDKVGVLYTTALASAVERTEALTPVLADAGITVIDPLETGFDFSAGQKNASTLINQNPDMTAIISIFDLWTAATVSSVKSSGKDIKVYSFYADAVNNPLMKDNPDMVMGLADGDMISSPLLAIDKLIAFFESDTVIDDSGQQDYNYVAVTQDTLPPGEQNGPVAPEDALDTYYAKWSDDYGITAP